MSDIHIKDAAIAAAVTEITDGINKLNTLGCETLMLFRLPTGETASLLPNDAVWGIGAAELCRVTLVVKAGAARSPEKEPTNA